MISRMLFHILLLVFLLVIAAAILLSSVELASFGIIALVLMLILASGRAGEQDPDPDSVALESDEPVP